MIPPTLRIAASLLLFGIALAGARAQEEVSPEAAIPAGPPPKAIPDSLGDAVGTWDLSLDGSTRRCVMTLSSENGPNGRVVRFPAGCRRALPVLNAVAGWMFADGGVRLVDRNIRPLLLFAARADRRSLGASAEGGEVYSLVPLQTASMYPATPEPSPALRGETQDGAGAIHDVAGLNPIPGSQPVLSANTLAPRMPGRPAEAAPTPGIYALDRFNAKDVCRIELSPRGSGTAAEADLAPARLLPGCEDSGIAVFDPAAWRFANGHMTLKSKRGHAVNLVASGEGSWRRDPDVGTTFVLRKVER